MFWNLKNDVSKHEGNHKHVKSRSIINRDLLGFRRQQTAITIRNIKDFNPTKSIMVKGDSI
jgi:hypothetical protein